MAFLDETGLARLWSKIKAKDEAIEDEIDALKSKLNGATVYKNLTPQTSYGSFNDGSTLPLISLTSNIVPVQAGSGDPSPTNIRPISGFTKANVVVSPTTDAEDGTTYTIQFQYGSNPLTVYGGTLDVVSGVLTVDRVNVFLKDLTFTRQARSSSVGGYYFRAEIDDNAISDTDATQLYSHGVSNNPYASKENCARVFESSAYLFVGFSDDMNIITLADFNTWVSNNQNASICYKIKTPQTIQLTPTQVNSLLGQNYISSDTGNITNVKYLGILNLS